MNLAKVEIKNIQKLLTEDPHLRPYETEIRRRCESCWKLKSLFKIKIKAKIETKEYSSISSFQSHDKVKAFIDKKREEKIF